MTKNACLSGAGLLRLACVVLLLACPAVLPAAYVPYAVDATTLHLWHLDDTAAPAADAVTVNALPMQGLLNGATLANASLAGLGTALSTEAAASSILLAAPALAADTSDNVAFTHADTATGAFTYEAVVKFGSSFDPAATQASDRNMEIICMENDGATDRVFQFRFEAKTASRAARLNFTNLRSTAQTLYASLPATGDHAPDNTSWFHVAVTYDGDTANAANLKFYWTKLTGGATNANLIATGQLTQDLQAVTADFSIGNEARSTGGSTEGFAGAIDEVRLSSVARGADEMMPARYDSDADGLPDAWELAAFGSLAQTAAGDPDNDGLANLEEFNRGLNPAVADTALLHRWSFNGVLTDSIRGSNAAVIDPDGVPGTGGASTLTATNIILGGGARGTSQYVSLGTNLLAGRTHPVTIELWATRIGSQNWSRVFDFGSSSTEYLTLSWQNATTLTSSRHEWRDSQATNTVDDTSIAYTANVPFHILLSIAPGAGAGGSTRVTVYRAASTNAELGAVRVSFDTSNSLATFSDVYDWLGRSQFTADNTANASYDEVRIWTGVLNAVQREYLHTAGPNAAELPGDSDGDGLPDAWETTYFPSITTWGASDDPDADGFTNLQEYQGGSNPALKASTPDDTDADGLPDSWEITYLGTTAYGASDDPDGDGYTNLQEYQAGTDPDSAASNPGDTDADGLPDAWETAYFGSLAQGPNDDFDGDGYTNLAEYKAGSLPNNANSFPAGPKVRFVPIEDGNTNTSEFGYAGASAINTVAFIKSALMTVSNQQFIAYYGRHATDSSYAYNNTIWVGRRTVGSNVWEIFRTTFTANDITDGHDVVCFGIDGAGTMHMSWGMHGDAFHYARSTNSVIGTRPIGFGPDTTMTGSEGTATYPQFLKLPGGDLLYIYRKGTSGAGDDYINRYTLASQTWTNIHKSGSTATPFIAGTGWSPDYNAYPNMPCLDGDGNLFFIWTWRDTYLYQSNHDFAYAKSTNGGLTWLRTDNSVYTLPITELGESGNANTMAQEILTIPQNSSIINQAGMCLDRSNNPVVATWWAPGTATNNYRRQYMVFFPGTNSVWQTRQVSNRANDPTGTLKMDGDVRDLGRPVAVCDKDDRLIVLYRDNFGSNGLTVAFTPPRALDPERRHWTTMDLTTDNLGNYEPVIDLERWQLDNVLHILYQPATGLNYTPPANTASQIGVVEWDAAAYFAHRPSLSLALLNRNPDAFLTFPSQLGWEYRLQTTTNLASAWETLATFNGTGGWLQHTHTGAGDAQRFWRLQIQEGGF